MQDEIEQWKRDVLQEYCKTCPAPCCTWNFHLSEEQTALIFEGCRDRLNALGLPALEREGDEYTTNFTESDTCPKRKDGLCTIYENPLKPDACRHVPLYVDEREKLITMHNIACPAANLKTLGRLFLEAMDKGYGIENMFGERKITREQIYRALDR